MEKRARPTPHYLVVDSRERAVAPFLDDALKEHEYVHQQINTGDYLICARPAAPGGEPAVVACVERKTLADFAASFKDARYENVKKMRALRARTGCRLYFFVEGPAFPSPSQRFARIPYASILGAMTNLMVRDGVFVVQTKDESHTAKRLADLLRAYDNLPACPAERHDRDLAPAVEAAAALTGETGEPTGGETEASVGALAAPEALTGRLEQTDDEAAVIMWARLHGVSVVLAKILTGEFSAADLATQQVDAARVRGLRTATGHLINKDAVESLLAVRDGSVEHAAKLLSGLRGVTPAMARHILGSAGDSLSRLCSYSAEALALVSLPQKDRTIRLGPARAGRIWRLLRHCARPARKGEDGPRLGPPGHTARPAGPRGGKEKGQMRAPGHPCAHGTRAQACGAQTEQSGTETDQARAQTPAASHRPQQAGTPTPCAAPVVTPLADADFDAILDFWDCDGSASSPPVV
jgi:ERCC4-type nuclease